MMEELKLDRILTDMEKFWKAFFSVMSIYIVELLKSPAICE